MSPDGVSEVFHTVLRLHYTLRGWCCGLPPPPPPMDPDRDSERGSTVAAMGLLRAASRKSTALWVQVSWTAFLLSPRSSGSSSVKQPWPQLITWALFGRPGVGVGPRTEELGPPLSPLSGE